MTKIDYWNNCITTHLLNHIQGASFYFYYIIDIFANAVILLIT